MGIASSNDYYETVLLIITGLSGVNNYDHWIGLRKGKGYSNLSTNDKHCLFLQQGTWVQVE